MTQAEQVRVGDVLRLEREPVEPDPFKEYVAIGVRSFGRGLFHYEPVPGDKLGRLRFFALAPGRLVVSNIKGWEGAVAVSTETDAGCVASNRFLQYGSVGNRIDIDWARWFFLSEPGNELLQRASPGSADRNRTLAIKRFEDLVIPLPPIDEQRRVAARLEAIRLATNVLTDRRAQARSYARALGASAIDRVIAKGRNAGWSETPLRGLAEVNPRRARLSGATSTAFVPMAAVDAPTGAISAVDIRRADEVNGSYRQFRRGDILFARITPCMQNGKFAIFEGPTEYGYGSSEFHIVRPFDRLNAEWIHRYLRSLGVRQAAVHHMTGTAGQQRVPASFLSDLRVPLPSPPDIAARVADLDRLSAQQRQFGVLDSKAGALLSAMLPAALNRELAALGG